MRCTITSIARHKTFFLCCFFVVYITTFLSVEVLFGSHDKPSINLISFIQRYDDSSSDEYLLHVEAKLKRVVHQNEEKKIDNDEGRKVTAKPISKRVCKIRDHQYFPHCKEKFEYLQYIWDQSVCLKDVHKIDGSDCSIYDYLTKVEPFCPSEKTREEPNYEQAQIQLELDGLLKLLPLPTYRWMHARAKQLWKDWVVAGKRFIQRKSNWRKRKVFVYMGSVAFQPWMMELAGKGGPVGELVQWTDIIAALYVLGHDVKVVSNDTQLPILDKDDERGCARNEHEDIADVIYTDTNGVNGFHMHMGYGSTAKYRCMYRILDSFGTFVEFNFPSYPYDIPGNRSVWGNLNLIPTQLMTLYPHTQDNSFLGFVIGSNENLKDIDVTKKKPKALIYAKRASYLQGRFGYLDVIKDYFEIHGTFILDFEYPSYVINHGPVSGAEIKSMLEESKLFIGVGFPYEGPGPMEAMAAGTVYIQPKFDYPRNKLNEYFFEEKPTLRKVNSQNPYMEEYVGEPYCYTIDVNNEQLLRATLKKIKDSENPPPKIPKEFTNEGMLERIFAYTNLMNFCNPNVPRWPPVSHMKVFFAETRGLSCKDVCAAKGLVCERTYFPDVNSKDAIESIGAVTCKDIKTLYFLHGPSYDPLSEICYLQAHVQLFSCMHEESNIKRLCPCRDFEKEQTALCKNCL